MGKHRKNKISSGALPEAENAPPSVQTDPVKEKNAAPGAAEPACVLPEGESVAEREAPAEPVKKKGIFGWKIFRYRFLTLMLMCIIMSFIGFLVENIFRLFRAGVINSRRQFLPFLFAYGIAVFALYVVDGTPREIFTQVDTLRAASLTVPQTIEVLYDLDKQDGEALPIDALSVTECADILEKYLA